MVREGLARIPAGCAVAGIVDRRRQAMKADGIVTMISLMHDRSNGLGGGFAVYGCYPDMSDYYAFHLFYESSSAQTETEQFMSIYFKVEQKEPIPVRKNGLQKHAPRIWRYFVKPKVSEINEQDLSEEEYIIKTVMSINRDIPGAFVASSGKNMGAFKAVGYPEDVADFYRLEEYQGYLWLAHGRFPTNTPGWWGGAHPFTLLDWSVVHNGEISSYGANRRYLEMFGYHCGLQTDTEAITYLLDLLVRKHRLPLLTALNIFAAPFWEEIGRMDQERQRLWKMLRSVYGSALLNGPFSIIVGCSHGLIAMNDRIKLRPLVAAVNTEKVYVASEEAAIRAVCRQPDRLWTPAGGEPVLAWVEHQSSKHGSSSLCDGLVREVS
ncbi:MAG TPA: glutamine amidotransferase family protein [Syntrophothermus lipocalidus]|nr:glutamine amidotransferase family protein [Syntrophothermus lipocalidus]